MIRSFWRHFLIWLRLVRMNLMGHLEYRANFVTGLLVEGGYLVVKLLYILVAYQAGKSIAGFGPDEILVFVGTFVLCTGFYAGLYMMNLFQLSSLVRDGSFDLILTKPVSSLFLATFRRSDVALFLLDVVAGLVLVTIGLVRLKTSVDLGLVLGYAFFTASGAAVGYALWLLPMTLVFRLVNADAIAGTADSFWDFNNVPMVVYNDVGKFVGVFVIPIFVITNFPSLFVLGRLPLEYLLWAVAAPVLFLGLAIAAWNSGLKRYTSGGN
jgi:ABC-2 type transport system permease protein